MKEIEVGQIWKYKKYGEHAAHYKVIKVLNDEVYFVSLYSNFSGKMKVEEFLERMELVDGFTSPRSPLLNGDIY